MFRINNPNITAISQVLILVNIHLLNLKNQGKTAVSTSRL